MKNAGFLNVITELIGWPVVETASRGLDHRRRAFRKRFSRLSAFGPLPGGLGRGLTGDPGAG